VRVGGKESTVEGICEGFKLGAKEQGSYGCWEWVKRVGRDKLQAYI